MKIGKISENILKRSVLKLIQNIKTMRAQLQGQTALFLNVKKCIQPYVLLLKMLNVRDTMRQ